MAMIACYSCHRIFEARKAIRSANGLIVVRSHNIIDSNVRVSGIKEDGCDESANPDQGATSIMC